MPAYLVETPSVHEWTVTEHPLTALTIDLSQIRLQSWTGGGAFEIRFSAPFIHTPSSASPLVVDVENPPTAAPLLELVGRGIKGIRITSAASLIVEFESGDRLNAEAHPDFEAWEAEFRGPFARRGYLCMAGGGSPWG